MRADFLILRSRKNIPAPRWLLPLIAAAVLCLGGCQHKPVGLAYHGITEIGIERTPCYGTCPVYTFIANIDGTFKYRGAQHVEHIGDFTGAIPIADFHAVANFIKDSKFDDLQTAYSEDVTDQATAIITVTMNGKRKAVTGYGHAGPPVLREIGKRIDSLMAKATWNEPRRANAPPLR